MIYKIYIPKSYVHNKIGYATNFNHVRNELKKLTKGWTEYDGQGVWFNDEGKEFNEPVKVFEIVIDDENDKCYIFTPELQETLRYFKSFLNQECMFYTVNNEGRYV